MTSAASSDDVMTYRAAVQVLFPRRDLIIDGWSATIAPLVDTTVARHPGTARTAGAVFEYCVGFDLSDQVPYQDALARLAPTACARLLAAAGFSPIHGDGLANGEVEYDFWRRTSRGGDLDVVKAGAGHVDQVYRIIYHKPEVDRSWFLDRNLLTGPLDAGVRKMVDECWELYIATGRDRIRTHGGIAAVRPVFHPRAYGDLVVGRTIVDIKALSNPLNDLEAHVTQLIEYLLFDQTDRRRSAQAARPVAGTPSSGGNETRACCPAPRSTGPIGRSNLVGSRQHPRLDGEWWT